MEDTHKFYDKKEKTGITHKKYEIQRNVTNSTHHLSQ